MKRFSLGILLCLLFACANTPDSEHDSSFLGDALLFKPSADGIEELYVAPGFTKQQLAQVDSFIVDPVMIWYADDSDYKGIFPDELKAISDFTRNSLITELSKNYKIVEQPGPGVLRIRAAITQMKRYQPMKAINYIPIGALFYGVKEVSGANAPSREKIEKKNSYIISATLAGGLYNSETGELLAAYKGLQKTKNTHQQAQQGATWGQVKSAIEGWAKQFKLKVDRAHGLVAAN
ncbi:DUF3313 domain-containing protein [Agaribacterium haliotis]|uniref:DUF3313 domain-containing protein n=1 Tax=Agaribacterium haliotis TaxID=2013869 RepID=UPI0013041945|nr:DUF3313 domain-containing protein [Agaribacterium haliotis]